VEVALTPTMVGLRDSKHPDRAHLGFAPSSWVEFLAGLKAGEFDLPPAAR
jgi:hypothetical protein